MLLTFSVKYEKLVKKEKLQTIRTNYERWRKWINKCERKRIPSKVQIYWGNPRNGGEKMGDGVLHTVFFKKISELNEKDARLDGFDSLEELKKELLKLNPELNEGIYVIFLCWNWVEDPIDVLGVV